MLFVLTIPPLSNVSVASVLSAGRVRVRIQTSVLSAGRVRVRVRIQTSVLSAGRVRVRFYHCFTASHNDKSAKHLNNFTGNLLINIQVLNKAQHIPAFCTELFTELLIRK